MNEHRIKGLKRADQLKMAAAPFLGARSKIARGLELVDDIARVQGCMRHRLGITSNTWNDWRWQLATRIQGSDVLKGLLPDLPQAGIRETAAVYRFAISPYYLSLLALDPALSAPLRRMVIPSGDELLEGGVDDPMAEQDTNPAPLVTRRYPDRLIINVTNNCGSFCRFCQRRRNIGQIDRDAERDDLEAAIHYVQASPEIRDVLVTGGDPLTMETNDLCWIIERLRHIKHVEVIRLGTRAPATLPQRVTPELCAMLKQYHPVYVHTHFNHPLEITAEAKLACERLADAGISLGNQAVLLKGVNNDPYVMRSLFHELLKVRVRPYYLFHPKRVKGTGHFYCPVSEGLAIMQSLRGFTSGMAIPTYIVNAPGGLGKIPLLPDYMMEPIEGKVVLRTWEGREVTVEGEGQE